MFGLVAALPDSASAHANYESSTPADGEVVPEGPERVDVFYSQEVARSGGLPILFVANQSGDVIADEAVLDDEDRTHISIELPPALPDGRYTVIWHTLSDEDARGGAGRVPLLYRERARRRTPEGGTGLA